LREVETLQSSIAQKDQTIAKWKDIAGDNNLKLAQQNEELETQRNRIAKKKNKIIEIKKKVDLLALRVSLLTNELTKQVVLEVPENKEETELSQKAKQVKQSFNSPVEAITNEIQALLADEEKITAKRVKGVLQNIGELLKNPTELHKPSITKIFKNVTLDKKTQAWMSAELGGRTARDMTSDGTRVTTLDDIDDNSSAIVQKDELEIAYMLTGWKYDLFAFTSDDLVQHGLIIMKEMNVSFQIDI
jgi:hypothetical protein